MLTCLLGAALLCLQPDPQGKTLYVDAQNAGPFDGSREHPFLTIRGALDRAKPGDTVRVLPGAYPENVVMPPGVRLTGASAEEPRKPVIRGTLKAADDAIVENLVVSPPAGQVLRAVYGIGTDGFRLQNVTVRDLRETEEGRGFVVGMDFWGCTGLFIADCRIEDLRETQWGSVCGLRLTRCQARLWRNTIRRIHEDAWGSAYGMLLIHSSGEAAGNVLQDIRETEWNDASAMKLIACRDFVVRNNTILQVRADAWDNAYGIYLDLDCRAVVENNIVSDVNRGDSWSNKYSVAGIYNGSDETVVRFNTVWGTARPYAGAAAPGNLQVDPALSGDPLLPAKDSPCRRAGNPALKNDDGSRSDIGATGGPPLQPYAPAALESGEGREALGLIEAFRAENPAARNAGAAALRKLGKRALPFLRHMSQDKDAEVADRCQSLVDELTTLSALVRDSMEGRGRGGVELEKGTFDEKLLLIFSLESGSRGFPGGSIPEMIEALKHDYGDREATAKRLWSALPPAARKNLDENAFGRDRVGNLEQAEELIRAVRRALKE